MEKQCTPVYVFDLAELYLYSKCVFGLNPALPYI